MARSRGLARVPVLRTLGDAFRLTFGRLGGWLVLIAVLQGIVVLLAVPGLHALFGAALQAAGVASLTLDTAAQFFAAPAGVALFVLLTVLGLLAILVQATTFLLAAAGQQRAAGGALPAFGELLWRLWTRLRGLLRPSTLLLVPYAFLLAPLGHAALGSVFSDWIAVPNFVSGELMKTPIGAIGYTLALAVIWYLNLRFVLTLPFIAVEGLRVPAAMAASWRATGWIPWRVAILVLGVVIPIAIAALLAGGLGLGATALGDLTETLGAGPDTAVVVAAIVSGLLPVLAFTLTGIGIALQSHVFVGMVRSRASSMANAPDASETPDTSDAPARPTSPALRRTSAIALPIIAAGIAALLAIQAFPQLNRLDDAATLVLGHRGAPTVAVENTIAALEAAHEEGADLVEFDTIQTADGDWVVMHDFNLSRLSGDPRNTADLTLDELTSMTVSTPDGHSGPIPSLREYVARAAELGQRLLIEIKPSGKETEDYLDSFFAILDEAGVAETSLYHSLSEHVVMGQKAMRPELQVGYILSVNVGGLPATPADFIVIEEWSYSPELRDAAWAAGKSVFVWTVNAEDAMRNYLRAPVDGVISDHPELVVAERESVASDRSLTSKLWDALDRLIAIG